MSILCGIDFSEASWRAAGVAAGIAGRRGLPLHLVHAMTDLPAGVYADEKTGLLATTRRALEKEAAKLPGGAEVHLHVELEPPHVSLPRLASELSAELLVFGATGMGHVRNQPVGRTADRLAQQSQVPALVVRSAEPFERWVNQEQPLRVVVGLDFNIASDTAWRWARDLGRVGPVALIGVHVYWPPHEFARLGLGGMRSYVGADPEVERVLRADMADRFHADGQDVTLRAEPGIGRPSDHLLGIALEEQADVIVVGSHRRSSVARLWEGSASRGVLHDAQCSVVCVPLPAKSAPGALPPVRTILAATDFSPVGNAAVAQAFALAGRGGKVYVVHVLEPVAPHSALEPRDIFAVSPALAGAQQAALEQLRALLPPGEGGTEGEVRVLEARDAAHAIAQAAERLGADVICIGTHGRSGLSKAILGSAAQGVLAHTERPTILVRAPRA